ncbi:hypothetical protein PRIC1_000021 [Phytophthora ramorum]
MAVDAVANRLQVLGHRQAHPRVTRTSRRRREHRFHFRYQLDDALHPVFRLTEGFARATREVNAGVSYTIKAQLGVQGKLAVDLETSHDLVVHRPSLCHPVRSLQKSSCHEVRLLSLMKSKGACEVSARLDSYVHTSGSTLSLQAGVTN